jgi:hypothetical protein
VFGAANNQAATNMDTVEGSLAKLGTSWDALVLKLRGSKGVIKGAIDDLTSRLDILSQKGIGFFKGLVLSLGGDSNTRFLAGLEAELEEYAKTNPFGDLSKMTDEVLSAAMASAEANYAKALDSMDAAATKFYGNQLASLQDEEAKRLALTNVVEQEAAKTDEATKTTTGLIQALTDKLEKLQESYKAATTIGQLQNLTSQIETTKRELEDLIALSEQPMLDKAQAANAGLMTPLTGVGGGSMSDAITPGMVDASMIMPDNVTSLVDVTIEQFDFFTRQIETYADQLGNTFQVMGDYATDWSIVTNDALMSVAASNISMLGENLGAALNGEQFKIEEAGNALLASLGKFIVEYGSSMVALGIGMNIITPGSGVNKVVGGLALIAAGSVLTGYGNSRNGRGGGGGGAVGGKTESNADEFQITSSQPGRGGNAIEANNEIYGEVVVRGSDLVIALSNQQSKNNRI